MLVTSDPRDMDTGVICWMKLQSKLSQGKHLVTTQKYFLLNKNIFYIWILVMAKLNEVIIAILVMQVRIEHQEHFSIHESWKFVFKKQERTQGSRFNS